jgi:hypothetical protein
MATSTPARGKIPTLAKKHITVSLCRADLFDDDVAVVGKKPLLSSLFRRARAVVTAETARVEEVLRAVPRMAEEGFRKRPRFGANVTPPPGQIWFDGIQLHAPGPQKLAVCFSFFGAAPSLRCTQSSPVRCALHVLTLCFLQPELAKVIGNPLVVDSRPTLRLGFSIPRFPDVRRRVPVGVRAGKFQKFYLFECCEDAYRVHHL